MAVVMTRSFASTLREATDYLLHHGYILCGRSWLHSARAKGYARLVVVSSGVWIYEGGGQ